MGRLSQHSSISSGKKNDGHLIVDSKDGKPYHAPGSGIGIGAHNLHIPPLIVRP